MNTSRMIVRCVTLVLVLLSAACSGKDSTGPAANADVAGITVRLVSAPLGELAGYLSPTDTITVALVADVRDSRGDLMSDRTVTWQLQLSSGAPAGDSIAAIASTGRQMATMAFYRDVAVAVIASVQGNDGVSRSGRIYLVRTP